MAKSGAQRMREYRERLREKLAEGGNEIHEKPKTNHERHVRHTVKKPMSVVERVQNYRAKQKALVNEIMPKNKTNLSPVTRNFRRFHARKRLTEGNRAESHLKEQRVRVAVVATAEQEAEKPCHCREQMRHLELRICHMEQLLERVLGQGTSNCSEMDCVVMGQPGVAPPIPLHEAVKRGETVALARALVRGEDPNALDLSGDTSLHCAARSGEVLSVELLLAAGASLHYRDACGATPLANAVVCGHQTTVEIFLERRASVDQRDKDWRTPLMHAVTLGNTQMVSLLLKHGASVNAEDINGESPLVSAARVCSMHVLMLLVRHSKPNMARLRQAMNVVGSSDAFMILVNAAPMAATCSLKSSLLARVAKEGWLHPVRSILSYCVERQCQGYFHDKNIQRAIRVAKTQDILQALWQSAPAASRRVAMSRAAAKGWATALEDIVSHWKNNQTYANHSTEIVGALRGVKTPEATMLLVRAHPGVALTSVGRETASRAAERGWLKVLEALIDHGAPVNSKWDGSPLLHSAASRGNTECVQMLVYRGASLQERDDHGRTPLHCAAEAGHNLVVDILLYSGADPTAKCPFGLTPYDVASTENIRNLLKPKPVINTRTGRAEKFEICCEESECLLKLLLN